MAMSIEKAISRVVDRGNCSGCGACTLIDDRVRMDIAKDGFLRPTVADHAEVRADPQGVELFHQVCPGVGVRAPKRDPRSRVDEVFGTYLEVWEAWASDADIRFRGSSGGVLTALSAWLLETGQAQGVVASAAASSAPSRTVPVTITSRAEALGSAGSRYGPVANLEQAALGATDHVIVGKPCEISALAQMNEAMGIEEVAGPVRLSFFCAGSPSQHATDELVDFLGFVREDVASLRYRGDGWPGRFTVTDTAGREAGLSYDESWGHHLGRNLQWRCKTCVDGTGGHADIAVGDYWRAGPDGYPLFDDDDGVSVVIARTARGEKILQDARAQGVIVMRPLELSKVAAIQPLQVDRKYTLVGRLSARWLALKPPPKYEGYGLLRISRARWRANVRALIGTLKRSLW